MPLTKREQAPEALQSVEQTNCHELFRHLTEEDTRSAIPEAINSAYLSDYSIINQQMGDQ